MSRDILVRFPDSMVQALAAERTRTGCPTSAFIRRAVAVALEPKQGYEALLEAAIEHGECPQPPDPLKVKP